MFIRVSLRWSDRAMERLGGKSGGQSSARPGQGFARLGESYESSPSARSELIAL